MVALFWFLSAIVPLHSHRQASVNLDRVYCSCIFSQWIES
jgi:hypothetical protein